MSDRGQAPDIGADVAAQLQEALLIIESSLLALDPPRPAVHGKYQELRCVRDQLEEALVVQQVARLRAARLDFARDVAALREVMKELERAQKRTSTVQDVVGYLATAVDLATSLVAKILPFL